MLVLARLGFGGAREKREQVYGVRWKNSHVDQDWEL